MRTKKHARSGAEPCRGCFGLVAAPSRGAFVDAEMEARARIVHEGTAPRPRRSTTWHTATHNGCDPGERQAGQVAAHERRDGTMRRRNAGGTTDGVDGSGGCGCKWTAQQRRWTNADLEFQNLSYIIVLGALEVLIW